MNAVGRLTLCLMLGGCSFHGPTTELGPGDGGGPDVAISGDGLPEIDGAVGDALKLDAVVNLDTDGDGVPDLADNCPTKPNPGQENEDGDRFGDVCDPCPPIKDDNPPDADGDGVADACDPHPTTAGDKIVLFAGFTAANAAGLTSAGTWANTAGDAHGTAATTGWLVMPLAATSETITAAMVVDGATGNPAGFGVTDTQSTSGATGITCAAYIAGPAVTGLAIATDDQTQHQESALAVAPGSAFTIAMSRTGTTYTCSATGAQTITRAFTLANASYTAGLRVQAGSAHYHWMMIVSN
jgi:hypothetical protein